MNSHFFILGAAKSGTTSLYYYLNQHPDICMSEPKEPIFFEAEYQYGLDYYYSRYFKHRKNEKYLGDARIKHLYLSYVAKRIYTCFPEAKLIVSLRNPTEVAYSSWLNMYAAGKEELFFDQAVSEDIKRIESGITFKSEKESEFWVKNLAKSNSKKGVAAQKYFRTYVDTGYYDSQIIEYLKFFKPSNLKVILFEDLKANPEIVTLEIFDFLNVEKISGEKINYDSQNVSEKKESVLRVKKEIVKGESYLDRLLNSKKRERIIEETKGYLKDHYKKNVLELENLINRDLSNWLK